MIYIKYYISPLGKILLSSDGNGLTGAWFEGQKYFPPLENAEERFLPVFSEAEEWFDIYFDGKEPPFTPKIILSGTDFRVRVWKALAEIPYGETAAYSEIAEKVGCGSCRAVGGAISRNNISVIIPCHRVIGADGSLTGYAGGLGRKEKLLALERAVFKKVL